MRDVTRRLHAHCLRHPAEILTWQQTQLLYASSFFVYPSLLRPLLMINTATIMRLVFMKYKELKEVKFLGVYTMITQKENPTVIHFSYRRENKYLMLHIFQVFPLPKNGEIWNFNLICI